MRSHELTHAGLRLARRKSRHNLRHGARSGQWWSSGRLLVIATFAVLERDAMARRRHALRPGAPGRLRLRPGGGGLRRPARRRDDRRPAPALGRLPAAHAARALLHAHRAHAHHPRRGLCHASRSTSGSRAGSPTGCATWWPTPWPPPKPTRRSTASRFRPTPARSREFLNDQKERIPLLAGGQLRDLLTRGQLQMQRALPKAYIIDGDGASPRPRRAELSLLVRAAQPPRTSRAPARARR